MTITSGVGAPSGGGPTSAAAMVDRPHPRKATIEFEGPQWATQCDLETKTYLRKKHVDDVLRSDWTPKQILIEADAAAACDFIPDSCRLYQEAAKRQAALDGREHNEMPERAE